MDPSVKPSDSSASLNKRHSHTPLPRNKNSSRSLRSITSFFGRGTSSKTLSKDVIDHQHPVVASANTQSNSSNLAAFLAANEPKLLSLTRNQKGAHKGELAWRASGTNKWTRGVGAVHENEGSLFITPAGATTDNETYSIIDNLRSVSVQINSELKQISLSVKDSASEKYNQVYLRLNSEDDFLAWISVFLTWTSLKNAGLLSKLYIPSGSVKLYDRNWLGSAVEYKVKILLAKTSAPLLAVSANASHWFPSLLVIDRHGLLVISDTRGNIIELNISSIIRHDIRKVNYSLVRNQWVINIDNLQPRHSKSDPSRLNGPKSLLIMFDNQTEFEKCFVSLKTLSRQQYYCPSVINLSKSIRTNNIINLKVGHGKFSESRIRLIQGYIYNKITASSGTTTIDNNIVELSIDIMLGDNIIARTTTSQNKLHINNNKHLFTEPFWYDEFSINELPLDFGVLKFVLRDSQNNIELAYAQLNPQDHITFGDNLALSSSCSKDLTLQFKSLIPKDDSIIGEVFIKLDFLRLKILAPNHYEHLEAMINDLSTHMSSRIASRFLSTPILLSDLGSSLNSLADSCTVISGSNPGNEINLSSERDNPNPTSFPKPVLFSSLSTLKGISSLLLKINMSLGCAEPWLISLIDQEIKLISTADENTNTVEEGLESSPKKGADMHSALNSLFRGNTLMSKCIDYYTQILGLEFLQKYIQPITDDIINNSIILEIDPNRLDEVVNDLSENKQRLLKYIQLTWSNIRDNIDQLPESIKRILCYLRLRLESILDLEKENSSEGEKKNEIIFNCLSAFIFLRFLCPAILNPKLFGLSHITPNETVQRSLTLIAKVIQTFANRAHFGVKESYMMEINDLFINRQGQELDELFDRVSVTAVEDGNAGDETPNLVKSTTSSNLGLNIQSTRTSERVSVVPVIDDLPSLPFLMDKSSLLAQLVGLWNEMTLYPTQSSPINSTTVEAAGGSNVATGDDGMIELFDIECQRIKAHSTKLTKALEASETPASISTEDWSNNLTNLALDFNAQSGAVRYRQRAQTALQDPVKSIRGHDYDQHKASGMGPNRRQSQKAHRTSIGHNIAYPPASTARPSMTDPVAREPGGALKTSQSFNHKISLDHERNPGRTLANSSSSRTQATPARSHAQRLPRWMSMNFFRS